MGWLYFNLYFFYGDSAIFPFAQAKFGRQWSDINQCQPNPGDIPPAPLCTVPGFNVRLRVPASLRGASVALASKPGNEVHDITGKSDRL